ncbi:MAG: hypothetical protein ACO3A2_08165 [Bdellovibrionia bacterium]
MKLSQLVLVTSLFAFPTLARSDGEEKKPQSNSSLQMRLEFGPAWQSVNRVQIPTPTGTRFDFTDLGLGPNPFFRVDASLKISEKSELRFLYAPLSLNFSGNLGVDVNYQGIQFSKAAKTEGLYRFNSYRFTYRYQIYQSERWNLKFGGTLKCRDAEIRLTQGSSSATRTDLGFVPLLNFLAAYQLSESMKFLLDVDALAAPQGRAEDIGLLLSMQLGPTWESYLGYRTVEGGADGGGNVYNFTWVHYAVLGLGFKL